MFQVFKFVVWTACAVGFGIFLAKGEIDGRTPIEVFDKLKTMRWQPKKKLKEKVNVLNISRQF